MNSNMLLFYSETSKYINFISNILQGVPLAMNKSNIHLDILFFSISLIYFVTLNYLFNVINEIIKQR